MKPGLASALLDGSPRFGLAAIRDEGHAEPELRRQIDPALPRRGREKLFWNREQQTSAVAAQSVRIHAAAMRKPGQRRERSVDHFPRGRCAEASYKTNSASVMIHDRAPGRFAHSS
jgi:hypothetical protein